jgi:hypothetical protein
MINSKFLENFCSSKSYNGIFNEPFINGKYVVATDSHSLIVVDKEEVESDDPLKESEKDYVGFVEEGKGDEVKNIKFTYSELLDALKQVPVSDNEEHYCPDCNGDGEVDFEYHSTHDYEYTLRGECPVCHGTGINDNFLYLHNVRGWFDKTLTAIETCGIWFNPKYIDDLVRIMNELQITSCTMECGSISRACLFILNNKVKFYLMPIFHLDSVENIIHIDNKPNINLYIE